MCGPSNLLPGGSRLVVEEVQWRLGELVMCQKPARGVGAWVGGHGMTRNSSLVETSLARFIVFATCRR